MSYVKIEDNVVIQKQPYSQEGFVKVHDDVICGMVHDGGESFAKESFSFPDPVYTWDHVRAKQRALILVHDDLMEIHEREVAHDSTDEASYTISPAQYQEMLSYFQTVRQNDEELHATPNDAMAALEGIPLPTFLN